MATGPRLSVDIAEKRYPEGSTALFSGLSLVVEPGTTLALVGPSGVGKSTLLRMIGGIDADFSGDITIDGIEAARAPAPGYVFQDPRLLPWLTVERNLTTLGAEPAAARSALARVGLADAIAAYPHQLSGGMQRRVALARALVTNPRLLLLDEPFVSLDRSLVSEMHRLVRDLVVETGATMVLVTHIPEDAVFLADRAVLLSGHPARVIADQTFDIPVAERSPVDIGRFLGFMAAVD